MMFRRVVTSIGCTLLRWWTCARDVTLCVTMRQPYACGIRRAAIVDRNWRVCDVTASARQAQRDRCLEEWLAMASRDDEVLVVTELHVAGLSEDRIRVDPPRVVLSSSRVARRGRMRGRSQQITSARLGVARGNEAAYVLDVTSVLRRAVDVNARDVTHLTAVAWWWYRVTHAAASADHRPIFLTLRTAGDDDEVRVEIDRADV